MKLLLIIIFVNILSETCSQVKQEWVAKYSGPDKGEDIPHCIITDKSGNVYVTGSSVGKGTQRDYATVKYNSGGIELWAQRYNCSGVNDDVARSIAVDDSGNIYITGNSFELGAADDYATIKYDSAGNELWLARYDGTGNGRDQAQSVIVDKFGYVYVTGFSQGKTGVYDYVTIKYNSYGRQTWTAVYDGPGHDEDRASSIALDYAGNVYVTGFSRREKSFESQDILTIKYSPAGNEEWIQRYNSPFNNNDWGESAAVDSDGNVYVIGGSYRDDDHIDYVIVKYNSSGVQQWIQTYTGPYIYDDENTAISVDNMGDIVVTTQALGSEISFSCMVTIYNAEGNRQSVKKYKGPFIMNFVSCSQFIDPSGSVFVAGYSWDKKTGDDFTTIKYSAEK